MTSTGCYKAKACLTELGTDGSNQVASKSDNHWWIEHPVGSLWP